MIRVGIVGATGYTALELIKLLLRHPEVQLVALTSRQEGNPHVSTVHRQLSGRLDLTLQNLEVEQLAETCDCVFSCLPHGASAEAVADLLDAGLHVVDFSADYRLSDVELYQQWYEVQHPDPDRVGQVPYGLPEWFRDPIREASLVANPGCYPTSAILALAPLLKEQLIEDEDLIVDSKSGVSGAGRTPKLTTHFPECNESVSAYNVGYHRHTPEIEQVLSRVTGRSQRIVFTPHLIPMDRGILTTAYGHRREGVTETQLMDALRQTYAHCPFVRVVEHLPSTKDTAFTNYCDISVRAVGERAVVVSTIDNLVKGASGAAVQNMNLMFGFPETTALL